MRRLVAVVGLAVLAACGDSGTEPQPFALSVSGPVFSVGRWIAAPIGTSQVLECQVQFQVSATGGGEAQWAGASVVRMDPRFGALAQEWAPLDMVDMFGSSLIRGGQTQTGGLYLVATNSFRTTVTLRYLLDSGEVRSASYTHDCNAP